MGDPVVGIHSLDRLYTLYRDDLLIAPFMGLLTYPLQIRYLDSPFLERLYWEPLFEDVLLTAPLWWPYFRFYENALNSGINILQVCADRWSRKIFNLFKKLGRYHSPCFIPVKCYDLKWWEKLLQEVDLLDLTFMF